MPRPKPKKGLSVNTAAIPIQFPPPVQEDIWEILNLDDPSVSSSTQKKVIQKIEGIFTLYPAFLVDLDNAPRPTAKLAEMAPLLRAVKQASKILGKLSDGARQDIGKAYLRGIPPDDPQRTRLMEESNEIHIKRLYRVIKDLKDFIPQLETAQRYLKTCSSQGGKIKQARSILTFQLTGIFDKYFNSVLEDTKMRELQVEFIQTVFKAYNKLHVVSDKLPTQKRTITRLLGPDSPSPQ